VLDHADYIARFDKQDVLGVVGNLTKQLAAHYDQPELNDVHGVRSIVLAGMGGSALAGEFIKTWLGDRLPLPFVIVRDYTLPGFVDDTTLVIVSSYSGNTEETLVALSEAESRGAKIVVATSGGALAKRAQAKSYPLYLTPHGFQPRMAVFYGVRLLAQLFEGLGLLDGLIDELEAVAKWAPSRVVGMRKDVPTIENIAKQIAVDIQGHPIVVYAGPSLAFAAMKWKIGLNENAKNIAFYNHFPELNHNEFIGWKLPESNGMKVIELRSDLDSLQIIKRFDISNRLLAHSFAPIEVMALGDSRLEQLVWIIILGEYVATYLAIVNGVDPFPVNLVEELKKELA
jgi:glucose/mannose-6-phosphate isomerase